MSHTPEKREPFVRSCPFCDNKPSIYEGGDGAWQLMCESIACEINPATPPANDHNEPLDPNQAAAIWNRRSVERSDTAPAVGVFPQDSGAPTTDAVTDAEFKLMVAGFRAAYESGEKETFDTLTERLLTAYFEVRSVHQSAGRADSSDKLRDLRGRVSDALNLLAYTTSNETVRAILNQALSDAQ